MTKPISIKYGTTSHSFNVDKYPSECGLCHKNVDPTFIAGAFGKDGKDGEYMEAAFQCTNYDCKSLIIGYYKKINRIFQLQKHAPIRPETKEYSDEVKEVSSNFVEIYNQSLYAEQTGLSLISGIGYRKALEFLVKDYLIYLEGDEEEKIKGLPLNQCIQKLENEDIKEISRRAAWIGNDEAHYVRKWNSKDINDLKNLIEITVFFIAMNIRSKNYLEEMS